MFFIVNIFNYVFITVIIVIFILPPSTHRNEMRRGQHGRTSMSNQFQTGNIKKNNLELKIYYIITGTDGDTN